MNTGFSLSKNISVDIEAIQGTISNDSIDLRLTLFSTAFTHTGVSLLYKHDMLDEWHDDPVITYSTNYFKKDNELHGLSCSATGSENIITWNYAANGIAKGSTCLFKVVVIPSVVVACSTDYYSHFETLLNHGNRIIDKGLKGTIVGLDNLGNLIVIDNHYVHLMEPERYQKIMSSGWLNRPVHATGNSEGGLIILDANGTLTEIDNDGVVIRSFDASAFAYGLYPTIDRHYATGNILISGGNISSVAELSWRGSDYGTTLWTYTSTPALNIPTGITYGDNINLLAFCDSENNQVVLIDRSLDPQSVTKIDSVIIDGQSFSLQQPFRCAWSNGVVYVCESKGRQESFGETLSSHPSLARSGLGVQSGINAVEQFTSMCFVPIARSIK